MKPSKIFFGFFWAFLCLVVGVTLVANICVGNSNNIVIIVSIASFLTIVSLWLYKRIFR